MLNFIYFFLSFGLAFLNPVYSGQSDIGVTDDFRIMLETPATSTPNESFASYVTRPFIVENSIKDKSFFSDPKTSRPNWDQQHKEWGKTQNGISPLKIFETMGISRRGLLSSDPAKHSDLSKAQQDGMLGIIRGDLGFADRSSTRDEAIIIARELLSIGNSMFGLALADEISQLEKTYNKEISLAKKQHLQISALLMLQGAKSPVEKGQWYLDGLNENAVSVTEKTYENLVLSAGTKQWQDVDTMLSKLIVGSGNNQQNQVIEAIRFLNDYKKTHVTQSGDEISPEIIEARVLLGKEFGNIRRKTIAVFPQERLDQYIAESQILEMFVGNEKKEVSDTLREVLSTWIRQNNNRWPDKDLPQFVEQFFWNLRKYERYRVISTEDDINLIKLVFNKKSHGNWKNFLDFCNPYLVGMRAEDKPSVMKVLLPIYQALPAETEKAEFINFCSPYLVHVGDEDKPSAMSDLLHVYQAFERDAFINFCNPYTVDVRPKNKPSVMRHLLHIYQALPTETERDTFINFCNPYLVGMRAEDKPNVMKDLLPIYLAFPKETERDMFINFCNPYLVSVWSTYLKSMRAEDKPNIMKNLLPIYLAFPKEIERDTFINFCNPYLGGMRAEDKPSVMKDLLPIYLALPTETEKAEFINFCNPFMKIRAEDKPNTMRKVFLPIYLAGQRERLAAFIRPYLIRGASQPTIENIILSYSSREYLRYIRAEGALKAEEALKTDHSTQSARVVAVLHETSSNDPLPVLWGEDPLLPQARNMFENGAANAHDFDHIYELDRPILWNKAQELEYKSSQSPLAHTIYNNHEIKKNYHTNTEVEDFITYLDHTIATGLDLQVDKEIISGTKVASIIKQMLGLEQKSGNTTGGFEPYLSSSMYYAKPDSPLGDEMLGRVWYVMKIISRDPKDLELNKKSVVLALLEASEISQTSIDTHCQTRTTGELMKLISWHLEGSNLRPLIAAIDLPPVQSDADIEARIAAAPLRAQELFKRIKEDDGGTIKRLIDSFYLMTGTELPLWKRYEAYYDLLYGRTKNDNGIRYRLDEHILMRDDHGNLVSKYNTDGSMKAVLNIVYYQSEFQVFEKTFTELMQKEFEKQRGLKY